MRILARLAIVTLLAPLSACYVGNTPPKSRAPHGDDAGAPAPERDASTPDDASPATAPPSTPMCERDEDCGPGATCVLDDGDAHCAMQAPAADAGPPQAGSARCFHLVCDRRECGSARNAMYPSCGEVQCGYCNSLTVCHEDEGICYAAEPDNRPRWAVRVVGASVNRCDTTWDRCNSPGYCHDTLPDPMVTVAGASTPEAIDTCSATYSLDLGTRIEDDLRAGLTASILDNDSPIVGSSGDTICGSFSVRFTDADFAAGRKVATCEGGSVTFALTRLVPRHP